MPPTNRIGIYYAPRSKELEPVTRRDLEAQIGELCERNFAEGWNLGSRRSYSEGYAMGWVHATALFLVVSVAVAVWRSL